MEALRQPVSMVDDAEHAAVLLGHPMRLRLLGALEQPDSATGLARRLDLPRQQVNYHLRELERAGFVALEREQRKGNCVERIVQRSAAHYLVSPLALGDLGDTAETDPVAMRDRFSWAYLVRATGRVLRDLTVLRNRADSVGRRVPTFTLETEARVASPDALNAMTTEIAQAIGEIVARHHDETAPQGRRFRVVLGSYPAITKSDEDAAAEVREAHGDTKGDSDDDGED
ncbi:MAG: winged helix-turn-helix domain-containing protein [Phycisphaerales bacterium]